MPLPNGSVGNKQISMNQMRTEFGISGAIAMNQLYRGGGEVPSTQTTTSTQNQGGTITKAAGSGAAGGQGGSFNVYNATALPVAAQNGDVITAYSGTACSITIAHNGQSGSGGSGVACQVQLGNSSGTASGSTLASFIVPPPRNNNPGTNATHTGTISPPSNYSLVNQAGATHLIYRISGGPGPQDNSAFSGSMSSTSMTITQNRTVSSTSNINTSVPSGGVGDTVFEFSDLWGAFDV